MKYRREKDDFPQNGGKEQTLHVIIQKTYIRHAHVYIVRNVRILLHLSINNIQGTRVRKAPHPPPIYYQMKKKKCASIARESCGEPAASE